LPPAGHPRPGGPPRRPGAQIIQAIAPDAVIAPAEKAALDGNLGGGLDRLDDAEFETAGKHHILDDGLVAAELNDVPIKFQIGAEEVQGAFAAKFNLPPPVGSLGLTVVSRLNPKMTMEDR
jgi:hypothetical protein